MAQNDKPVIVTLSCEAHPSTATEEIDRAEWDSKTPAERLALLETLADTHMANAGGYGWGIEDPEDEAAVASTAPDPLCELPADPIEAAALLDRLTSGLTVSVDMSTGDDDVGARVYGRLCSAQEDGADGHPVILLAELVEDTRRPDLLRELAEWLVSLDGHPLMMDRPTRGDMQAIIRRAREALGETDEG